MGSRAGVGGSADKSREPFTDTDLNIVWHSFRIPVEYATILTAMTLALVWWWAEGFVLAALATIAHVETRFRLRHPTGSPLASILLDTTLIGAAVFLARVPLEAVAVPFVYLGVTALMLLSLQRALWVFGYGMMWLVFILSAPGFLNRPPLAGVQGLVVGVIASVIFAGFAFALIFVLIGALRRYLESLRNLVRSKDEFVASVSHELRTPLTAIVGFAQQLDENQERFTSEEQREMIGFVLEQSSELASLIEDLLIAARADIGTLSIVPAPVDLQTLAESVITGHARTHGSAVVAPVGSGPVTAWADPTRVRQILRNLLTNAERYGGGSHYVTLAQHSDRARIRVCDNGPGIDPADRERIFQPYQRAHQIPSQPASVGLGLAVSRTLALLMNGDLTYSYCDGESVFELELPTPRTTVLHPDLQRTSQSG